ncbi:MAG: GGDEF domain-containing protein [Cyanobacteria bacterium REEB67]|nr:GGDEF domain-containing protein [Cyanobacteria bacterium REEB67]
MKARIAEMLQTFHGQSGPRPPEGPGAAGTAGSRRPQGQNPLQYEKLVREKDREIDRLRHQLANAEARLQELMGQDVLTQLPNRHIFKEHLTHSLKRALRLGYSLSLMLIDIDHLRDINLKYGHEVGDLVLVEVAKILRSSVREIDMPARWGGEELVAVLHETDADGASVVAERVRRRISVLEIREPKTGKAIKITASLAVASYPQHSGEPQGLLEAASEALIQAKEDGCNRVLIANR